MASIGSTVSLILLERHVRNLLTKKKSTGIEETEVIFFQYPHYSEQRFVEILNSFADPTDAVLIKGYTFKNYEGLSIGFLEVKKNSVFKERLLVHLDLVFEVNSVLKTINYPHQHTKQLVVICNTIENTNHCFLLLTELQSMAGEKFQEVFSWESVIILPHKNIIPKG